MNYTIEYLKELFLYRNPLFKKTMENANTVYKMTKNIEIIILKTNGLMVDTFAKV